MGDLIDREELKKAAKRIESLPWGDEEGNRVEFQWSPKELEHLIDKAPSARCKDGGDGMKDLIDRKQALKEISDRHNEAVEWFLGTTNNDFIKAKAESALASFTECYITILKLPSAEPKWIPVTERLPEKHQYVLVTYNGLDGRRLVVVTNWNPDTWIESNSVAWMPVPEPYKVGDSE